MIGNCAARESLLDYTKITYNGFISFHKGQGGYYLSITFFCTSNWSRHGQIGEGESNVVGDNWGGGIKRAVRNNRNNCFCDQFNWLAT